MYRSLARKQAIVLALLMLAALGLGTLGLFAISSRAWLPDAFHVRAALGDVDGIEVGTRVRVQGLDAGEVESLEAPAGPGDKVLLRLRLSGKFRPLVGSDATVEVANESMLGSKVVRVVPGRAGSPPAAEDALLAGRSKVELADELARAVARLDHVLGAVEGVTRDVRQGKGSLGKLLADDRLYEDLTATVGEVKAAVREVRQGQGTLGRLVQGDEAYREAVQSLQEVRRMVGSVKQNADAIKALPLVRSYVVDVNKELMRPDCKRHRKWFREEDLFEPGRAVLTDRGRQLLDEAAGWLNDRKERGSEVVVAACADPRRDAEFALALTRKQSEVVLDYLKANHRIQRMGFWWWSNRRVRAVGCGTTPPPVPETERLPAARVELLVFVPQNG